MSQKPGMVQDPEGCFWLLLLCGIGAAMWVGIIFTLANLLAAVR